MSPPPSVTLVVATYNQRRELECLLAACDRQSFRDFELIIADDGSGPAVAEMIRHAQEQYSYPITHLWHADNGWQKNRMLNNGIRAARSEQIVFIDGDCIPSRHFLADHQNEYEPGKILLGRRVEMSPHWSKDLTPEKIRNGEYEQWSWRVLLDGARGKAIRLEDGVRIKSRLLRTLLMRDVEGILGCNFSAAKEDLVAVNGFDELYRGPGCGEDSDIQYRLSLIGVTGKSMRNLAILYHLHHPLTRVSQVNLDRFAMVLKSREPRCAHGLEQLA